MVAAERVPIERRASVCKAVGYERLPAASFAGRQARCAPLPRRIPLLALARRRALLQTLRSRHYRPANPRARIAWNARQITTAMSYRWLHIDAERMGLHRSHPRREIAPRLSSGNARADCGRAAGTRPPRSCLRGAPRSRENADTLERLCETEPRLVPRCYRAPPPAAQSRNRAACDSSGCVSATRPAEKAESARAEEPAQFYRCPACGDQVDSQSPEQIRAHHHQVLHREALEQRSTLSSAARNHAAQTWIHGQRTGCS